MQISKHANFALVILSIVCLACVSGAPVKRDLPVPPAELFKFMRQFGYLGSAPDDSESLYSEAAIVEAVKMLQKFGGLNETGELSNETLQLLITPRCGVSDVSPNRKRKRFIIGGPGWKKRTVTYHVANWSPKVGTEEKVKADMKRAFDVWAPFGRLKFEESNVSSADIIIFFGSGFHGDSYPFDGPGNILAHAFYPYDDGSFGGDVHFDSDENWRDGARSLHEGVDFLSVAIHELGHALGLAHSYNPSAVMFPYYRGGASGHNLEYDDIMGMYELYLQEVSKEDLATAVATTGVPTTTTPDSRSRDNDADAPTTTEKIKRRRRTTTTTRPASTWSEPLTTTYEGDYETVDRHRSRFTASLDTSTPIAFTQKSGLVTTESVIPDICVGSFDAVGLLRGEVFIFKGQYVWRLTDRLKLYEGYPMPFRSLFGFPAEVGKIDAVYERQTDSSIVFFVGSNYWVYDGESFVENTPRPIQNLGISSKFTKIDAAMIWAKNGKTYLFSGNHFWRYNETTGTLDAGYPMTMDRWYGIPADLDAAVTFENGKTYFFKGNRYWLFNNFWVRPEKKYPRKASKYWLGCQ